MFHYKKANDFKEGNLFFVIFFFFSFLTLTVENVS